MFLQPAIRIFLEQVTFEKRNAFGDLMKFRIFFRDQKCACADVACENCCVGNFFGEGDGNGAGSGADVPDGGRRAHGMRPYEIDHLFGLGAGDEGVFIDDEGAAVEIFFAKNVRNGFMFYAARDELVEFF